jgi:hypothetical protein
VCLMCRPRRIRRVHQSVLRTRVKGFEADAQQSFPGDGQMNPERGDRSALARGYQAEGETSQKRPRPASRRSRREVRPRREAPGRIWPAEWLCGALGVSRGCVLGAAGVMKSWARTFAPAFSPATEPTGPGWYGMTCLRRRVVRSASRR